jgi:hypothetical protein
MLLDDGLPSSAPGPDALTDDDLAALALAADPDAEVGPDAVSVWDVLGVEADQSLPGWYMPAPVGGRRLQSGWRRRTVLVLVATFLAINAAGLCFTYGSIVIG